MEHMIVNMWVDHNDLLHFIWGDFYLDVIDLRCMYKSYKKGGDNNG